MSSIENLNSPDNRQKEFHNSLTSDSAKNSTDSLENSKTGKNTTNTTEKNTDFDKRDRIGSSSSYISGGPPRSSANHKF